jgi:urease accessory protein
MTVLDGLASALLPAHLLALVALGLTIGQGERRTIAIAAFALGLATGSAAIALAVRDTPAALGLLAMAAFAGIALAAAWPPPNIIKVVLAFATGAAITLNSPPQAITLGAAIATQLATAVAALVVLALVVLIAMHAAQPWQRIAVRIVGSWIAASAILVIALRLAR